MIYTKQEKQKLEQVISVFAERLKESDAFDFVWSDKVGYVLLDISPDYDYVDTARRIDTAEELCRLRWFRSWSDRRRTNSFCTRCWCKLRPVHFGESMYDCRNPGKCRSRSPQRRDSYRCKCQGTGRSGRDNTHYSLHGRETNVRLQRMCPGTNTFRTTGSCQ